jgi:hypothetical protein
VRALWRSCELALDLPARIACIVLGSLVAFVGDDLGCVHRETSCELGLFAVSQLTVSRLWAGEALEAVALLVCGLRLACEALVSSDWGRVLLADVRSFTLELAAPAGLALRWLALDGACAL